MASKSRIIGEFSFEISTNFRITDVLKLSRKKLAPALGARVLIVAFAHYRKAARL